MITGATVTLPLVEFDALREKAAHTDKVQQDAVDKILDWLQAEIEGCIGNSLEFSSATGKDFADRDDVYALAKLKQLIKAKYKGGKNEKDSTN